MTRMQVVMALLLAALLLGGIGCSGDGIDGAGGEGKMSDDSEQQTMSAEVGAPARFDLALEHALTGEGDWSRRALVHFAWAGGEAFGGEVHSDGSITHALYDATVQETNLHYDGEKLAGTIIADVTDRKEGAGRYAWTLDGTISGGEVSGQVVSTHQGEVIGEGRLHGTVDTRTAPGPRDALYRVVLHDALPGGKFLRLWLTTDNGQLQAGFGTTPRYNHAIHVLDHADLEHSGSGIRGTLEVTITPDPWVPADGQPIECRYRVEMQERAGELVGTFQGTCGGEEVDGKIAGHLQAKRQVERERVAGMYMKLEEALAGGEPWQNRAFINLDYANGQLVGGRVWNNKPNAGWNGELAGVELRISPQCVSGTIAAEIAEPEGRQPAVELGTYTFRIDAKPVGEYLVGEYTSRYQGRQVQAGRFAGRIELSEE
ncbi:MAG: hypothetical protein ACOC93_04370 [Planctomycetota bacterium]